MTETTPYKLYATCLPVKGYSRSTICDLQRNQVYPIPNILFEILQNQDLTTIAAVKRNYGEQYSEVIDEYFSFLLEEELIFFTKTPELFPPLSLEWHNPATITNAIIDVSIPFAYDVKDVLMQLEDLGCRKIEIRCYEYGAPAVFSDLLENTKDSIFNSIGIITRFDPDSAEQAWKELCDKHARITSVILHGSPECKEIASDTFRTPIQYVTTLVTGPTCCGVIQEDYFTSLIEPVSEAHHYNSCLNRKIGIDLEGNIKNCPSMAENFGHITTTTLAKAMSGEGFKNVWNVSKDHVRVCQDCEFRYVCTDCRAYLDVPNDLYSKPLKCGYDPYTCEWKDWSTHPLKQEATEYYDIGRKSWLSK